MRSSIWPIRRRRLPWSSHQGIFRRQSNQWIFSIDSASQKKIRYTWYPKRLNGLGPGLRSSVGDQHGRKELANVETSQKDVCAVRFTLFLSIKSNRSCFFFHIIWFLARPGVNHTFKLPGVYQTFKLLALNKITDDHHIKRSILEWCWFNWKQLWPSG